MCEIKLYLSKASTKYLDHATAGKKIDYRKPIGSLIYHLMESSTPILERRAKFNMPHSSIIEIPSDSGSQPQNKRGRHSLWIPPEKMVVLDKHIKEFLRAEILLVVEYVETEHRAKLISKFQDKYALLESEWSFSSIKKYVYRHTR
jgi:hypothetical protein